MKKFILFSLLFFAACSTGTGDAYLFIDGLANTSLSSGIDIYTEATNSSTTYVTFQTKKFYIAITDIKIKTTGKDWITLKEATYSFPVELVRGVNLVNGFPVKPEDYNIVLIGYKANWNIEAEYDSISTNITNSINDAKKYVIFYNSKTAYNEISSQFPGHSSMYWNVNFSLFAGDNKYMYIKFDTENSLKGLTNASGTITNVFFIPPKIYVDLR
ncbi:MAG: hypothetical protein N2258_06695 [Brevinematales bacterium]|nr:hypothetical protein [Brevinematales bacterium]